MSKKAPCGGCPPCCSRCVFEQNGSRTALPLVTLVSAKEYGCVQGEYPIVLSGGRVGQLRGEDFHPISSSGADFLRKSNNALASYL